MKIDVIITNYNYGKFFEECYLSILKQTLRPTTIFVVDDLSTDNSIDVIKRTIAKYKDTPLAINTELIIPPAKGYVGGSKNRGIENSQAEVLCMLDGDDIYLPSKIEKTVNILKRYPEVGIVYSDYYMLENNKNTYEYKYSFSNEVFSQICCISTNQTVRKEVFSSAGLYKENWKGPEDYDMWSRAIKTGWLAYHIPEPLFVYRVHGNNVTLTTTQNIIDSEKEMKSKW